MEADSTFEKTLEEDNTIEGARRAVKAKVAEKALEQAEDLLKNCKLDGSVYTYEDSEEEVVGLVVGDASGGQGQLGADNVEVMPDIVNFEDENGADTAGALREGIQAVSKVNWDDNDLKFVFKKLEISMSAAGAKKQYTKFQIVSTILPKHIEDEVKCLLEMQETEFECCPGEKFAKIHNFTFNLILNF